MDSLTLNPCPFGGVPLLVPFDDDFSDDRTPWRVVVEGSPSPVIVNSKWHLSTPYFKTRADAVNAWNGLFPVSP